MKAAIYPGEGRPVTIESQPDPKPGPGEIIGDEFMNIVKSEPEDKVILDVRTTDESTEGRIEWAVNIPLDDLTCKGLHRVGKSSIERTS